MPNILQIVAFDGQNVARKFNDSVNHIRISDTDIMFAIIVLLLIQTGALVSNVSILGDYCAVLQVHPVVDYVVLPLQRTHLNELHWEELVLIGIEGIGLVELVGPFQRLEDLAKCGHCSVSEAVFGLVFREHLLFLSLPEIRIELIPIGGLLVVHVDDDCGDSWIHEGQLLSVDFVEVD